MGTRFRKHLPCKCECGELSEGYSKYISGHQKIASEYKRRLRRLKRYANDKGIYINLNMNDIRDILKDREDLGNGVYILRISKKKGFVKGNLKLKNTKARKQTTDLKSDLLNTLRYSEVKNLNKRFEKEIARSFGENTVMTIQHTSDIYRSQEGRCAATGLKLMPSSTIHPNSIRFIKKDASLPWTPENAAIVTYHIHTLASTGMDPPSLPKAIRIAKAIKNSQTEKGT